MVLHSDLGDAVRVSRCRVGIRSDRTAPPFAVTIRLGQCFSLMLQMWSGLVRPAGGGTELEPLERSWTK